MVFDFSRYTNPAKIYHTLNTVSLKGKRSVPRVDLQPAKFDILPNMHASTHGNGGVLPMLEEVR